MSYYPVDYAVRKNNLESLEYLVKHRSNIIQDFRDFQGNNTLLHFAIQCKCNCKILQFLIEHGAHVNAQDFCGDTPLHLVCQVLSNLKIAKLLIKYGANPNIENDRGETPLYLAILDKDNLKTVKLLVVNGAEMNAISRFGYTLFLRACETVGNIEMVKFLHQNGGDIKTKDVNGNGPLHYAARYSLNDDILEYLLENGADLKQSNNKKRTPFYDFASKGKIKSMETLLNNGAEIHAAKVEFDFYVPESFKIEEIDIILKHLIKLEMFNLVKDDVLEAWKINENSKLDQFVKACRKEAEKLKEELFPDRNFRISDLLTNNLDTIVVCLQVDEIMEALSQINFSEKFPIYSGLLITKFKRCKNLAKLLAQGTKSLHFVLSDFRMSDIILNKIMHFLTEEDIQILNSMI